VKKRYLIILLTVFILAIGSMPVFASTSPDEKVIFNVQEIQDWNDLEQRMDNGVTDDSSVKVDGTISDEIYTDDKGRQFKAIVSDKKITSQKVKTVKTKEGKIVNSYVANAIVETRLDPLNVGGNLMAISGSDNDIDYNYYTLGTAYVTLYYQVELNVSFEGMTVNMFKPTSVKGKVVRADSQIVFDNIRVKILGNGDYYSDSFAQNYVGYGTKTDSVYSSTVSVGSYYTKTASNTKYWWPIYAGAYSDTLEGSTTSQMHRGGTYWDLDARVTFDDTNPAP